jgi:drug/metabolite transporter (DMT)-like permease
VTGRSSWSAAVGMFVFRVGHVIRENPWVRALLGGVMIVAGVIWVVVGGGHGRLAAVGALLLVGGVASGVRGRRTKRMTDRERGRTESDRPAP